jgi:chromosomal replication initiation ATPase DnaA
LLFLSSCHPQTNQETLPSELKTTVHALKPPYSHGGGRRFELVGVLNNLYLKETERNLPYVDVEPPTPAQTAPVLQPRYTLDDLVEDTGFEKTLVDKWIRSLDRKKQVILQCPPGTGKTYLAERLARFTVSKTDSFYEVIHKH